MPGRLCFLWAVIWGLLAAFPGQACSAEIKDGVGRIVNVPAVPRRIVSLAPNLTEILFALGAGGKVAGVTDYCDYPPEARSLPRVGGFVNPSLETAVSLKPDLVLATSDGNRPADVLGMEKLGLAVFVLDTRTLDDIYQAIKTIGRLVGEEVAAGDLVAAMSRRHAEIAARIADLPRPGVLFLAGLNPLVGVGPGTFLDNLIREAGGVNVLARSPVRYPLLGMENILGADPDVVILDVSAGEGAAPSAPGWDRLRAVREGRVHRLRDDTLLRPGPRIMDGLQALADILHPASSPEAP